MFEQLIESGPQPRSGLSHPASSIAVHAALVMLVLQSVRQGDPSPGPIVPPIPVTLDFPAPPRPVPSTGGAATDAPLVGTAPMLPADLVADPITLTTPIYETPAWPIDSLRRTQGLARQLAAAGSHNTPATDWLGATARDIPTGAEPPTPILLADPVYPPSLRSAGIEGGVTIEYVVGPGGLADSSSIRVIAVDFQAFGEAAAEAVRRSRFHPGTSNGRPVPVRVRQLVRFLVK